MFNFKKILCPVDFSDNSIKALQWAEYFAKRFDSLITVLHTIDIPLTADPYLYDAQAAQSRAEESLRNFIAPLTVKNDYLVSFGDPATSIRKIAEDLKADLIVMGTRGLTGFRHKFIGSTAESIMRSANMPVVTISPVCGSPDGNFNRILLPIAQIENVPAENKLMKFVVDALNTQATLMHVISYSDPMYKVKSELMPFNSMTLEAEVTQKKLMNIGKLMFEPDQLYTYATGFGDIVTEILREANSGLYDFILMSSHSENALTPFNHSKGYNILCHSMVPVISVMQFVN